MWPIIENEWRFLLKNAALRGASAVFLLLLAASVYLGHLRTERQAAQYATARDHLRAQWEGIEGMNPHGAAHYGTYVFKPTDLLSGLDEGVRSVTGNVLRVEGHVQNEMVHSEASQVQAISRFGKLNSSLLLQYIVPLLLVFLAFHGVSSERQSGRLKLLVLQGARLSSVVWGKAVAVWLYGFALLTLTVLVYALFNLGSLTADVLGRTLLLYAAYLVYYFVVCGLTAYCSARWRNPTLALTAMVGLWMVWSVFLPHVFISSVERWHELPSRSAFRAAMREDRSKGLDGHNPADARAEALKTKVLREYGVDSVSQLPINFDGLVMQADEEYGNQVWDKHFGELRKVLAAQKRSYQWAGALSPFIALQNASMGFAGSDNLHHQAFLVQAESYRRVFIKELNDKHAYGGSKTGDWGWQADNAFFRSVADFQYQPVPLAAAAPRYVPDLLTLLAWAGVVALLLFLGLKSVRVV